MDLREVTQVMTLIALEYQNFQASPERVALWHELLAKVEFQDVRPAVIKLLRTGGQFPPQVGELIEEAQAIRGERCRKEADERRQKEEAEIAAMPRIEYQRDPNFDPRKLLQDCLKTLEEKNKAFNSRYKKERV